MKRADIKRMLRETHPDNEPGTDITEAMTKNVSEETKNRIKEKGLSKIRAGETGNSYTEKYVNADIRKKTPGKFRFLPAAVTVCLAAGIISVPVIISSRTAGNIPDADSVPPASVTENSESTVNTETASPDFELVEVKTFSEYKVLSSVRYAARVLNIGAESGYRNFAMLAYQEPGAQDNTYIEFISSHDIPEEYIQKSGCNITCGITDFYVAENDDIYYCGWFKPLNSDIKDGIVGKYNANTGETVFLNVFDRVLFERIMTTENGELLASDEKNNCYQLDSSGENLQQLDDVDVTDWPGIFTVDTDCPYYSQYGHDFNGRSYMMLDFMTSYCSELVRLNMMSGESKILYSKYDFDIGRDGKIYTFDNDGGNSDGYLLEYKEGSLPLILGNENIGNSRINSCDINILTDFWDFESGKDRHSLYSPDGEKLYDFDIFDGGFNWLGNISDESGEKIYFIYRDENDGNSIQCFEPETNKRTELTTLNDNFDFDDEKNPVFITMTKSEKFDFLIWNNEYLYGYKINTDELTLITDTLDCCETEFTGFTADDNGNIYCVVYGSNTLYSIVPIDRIIDSEENDPEQIAEKSEFSDLVQILRGKSDVEYRP